ncbi:hypothetical protein Xbed_00889 [Xenorhabdus beddingii]|uniref:Transposase n=1 Tax=Xenorhabdus beddingii TaxID=40578 RepID=A0A1Y2SQ94_9GAMM|nr:transposase [Xenorhabdus beddingii]OTA21235.1 hypothetical protein Xbed_00889 [Xenorhabdus beddingii]
MRRNRYTPEQKQQHVTQWRQTALTRKQYCEQHQLTLASFRNWITDSNKRGQHPRTALPAVLPVSLQPASEQSVTLHTPDGYAIVCPLTRLPELMQVLKRC